MRSSPRRKKNRGASQTFVIDAPPPDVVEVSIFGPGKGECVVVHLGHGRWVVIDSCRDQGGQEIPPLRYFDSIGVVLHRDVEMVVGTHAHDDHFAGIADILAACSSAVFVCSSAATGEEMRALVKLDAVEEAFLRAKTLKEYRRIYEVIESRGRLADGTRPLKYAIEQRRLIERSDLGYRVSVTALSPSDEAVTRSRISLSKEWPAPGERRKAPSVDPNELSVALWVEVGGQSVLLGADLLNGPAGCGWGAVLATSKQEEKATLFKVPHHGSPNAHHPEVWSRLLSEQPMAILAPFRAGRTPRPAAADRARICSLAEEAYVTANPDLPSPSSAVRRERAALGQLAHNVREPWGTAGHVRARSAITGGEWAVDHFPPARPLCRG